MKKKRESWNEKDVLKVEKEYGDKYTTIIDKDYADVLKQTYKPIFVYPKTTKIVIKDNETPFTCKDPLISEYQQLNN